MNYEPILASLSKDITRWMTIPLSLLGRISWIKMTILPKLLYLFQLIPLAPPPSFFSKVKKLFLSFIWNNRKPRLRLSLLYMPYDRGRLQLPNIQWYYWSCPAESCHVLVFWRNRFALATNWTSFFRGINIAHFFVLCPHKKFVKKNNQSLCKKTWFGSGMKYINM